MEYSTGVSLKITNSSWNITDTELVFQYNSTVGCSGVGTMSYIVQQSTATSRKIVGIAGAGIGKETHFIEVKTDGTLRDHVGRCTSPL